MNRIILASKSPRRKKLLSQIGLAFEIFPSSFTEDSRSDDPVRLVEDHARLKAEDVAESCPDSLIIGADTVVTIHDEILEKPASRDQAFEMLTRLSGSWHSVYTGVCLLETDENGLAVRKNTFHEQTKVLFSTLSSSDMLSYIESGSPMDKAGAYGIQDDWGAIFVERIEGDYYNVVGFPLNRFYREVKSFNPDVSFSA